MRKIRKSKMIFSRIETEQLAVSLRESVIPIKYRIAYCIGLFRKAMVATSEKTGIKVEIYPTQLVIDKLYDADGSFPDGSLSMQRDLNEFREVFTEMRDRT